MPTSIFFTFVLIYLITSAPTGDRRDEMNSGGIDRAILSFRGILFTSWKIIDV